MQNITKQIHVRRKCCRTSTNILCIVHESNIQISKVCTKSDAILLYYIPNAVPSSLTQEVTRLQSQTVVLAMSNTMNIEPSILWCCQIGSFFKSYCFIEILNLRQSGVMHPTAVSYFKSLTKADKQIHNSRPIPSVNYVKITDHLNLRKSKYTDFILRSFRIKTCHKKPLMRACSDF
jgi:hypothetical protein